jgi:serine/threonine protein kinase/WD40 repeat protein
VQPPEALVMRTVNVIEGIFFAALEKQTPAERNAYLDEACRGDPELRVCVDRMLKAQPRMGEFLQPPAPGPLPETVDHRTDERPGTVLGPYKLLHEIGEGGMGAVWMAEQTEPVKRRVALKVIKPGMDSKQVLARFEAERQALALMDHPNIAKVLDAGTTAAGRPYFVMELVKGQPITEFCDKNRLTNQERLELFVAVCNAIQHAHQKGVIHRDVKPSNVLVALYDGRPVPKVIDFGVAKAVGDPLTDKTLFTRHGQVVGTFEYMSPEQATLDQLDIDTRSDVYALGVLLYELLTGTTPLDKDELRRGGLAEVLRRIREQEPPRPSTRLTSTPGLLATAAAYRKTDSQRLPRAVRGELDWIVMKALDKDRNRRFPSASELAVDVGRYLRDEPVQACPPTLGYRVRKYARKNKVAFATGTAVAAALVIGLALASWQAVRATHAQALAKIDRDAAIAAGKQVEDERDKTKTAFDRLTGLTAARRADQYAADMATLPVTWDAGNVAETRAMLDRQRPVGDERDLRNFEWYFWDRRTHAERMSVKLPFEGPNARPSGDWTFSGDGTRLALVQWPVGRGFGDPQSEPKELEAILTVWDVATQKIVRTHRFACPNGSAGSRVNNLVLPSHDGKRLLLSQSLFSRTGPFGLTSTGTSVEVFDVESGKVIRSLRLEKELPFTVHAAPRLTRDGRKLIVDIQTRELQAGSDLGPPSKLVGSEIQVFDLDAGDKDPLTIPDAALRALSADGSRLVTSRPRPNDGTFLDTPSEPAEYKIWDTETGKELAKFELLVGTTVHTDGKNLFSVVLADGQKSDRLLLKSWSLETGKERLSVPLSFAAITQPRRRTPTGEIESIYIPLAFLVLNRDGTNLLVGKSPRGPGARMVEVVTLIDAQTGQIRATVENPNGTADRALGPDFTRGVRSGQPFFTADGQRFVLADDNVIRTFDSRTGKPLLTLRGHENAIAARAEGPDGRLWSVEADGTLKQWNLQPPEPVRIGTAVLDAVAEPLFALSANGAWVARVHVEKVDMKDEYRSIVEVWDTAGKAQAKVLKTVGGLRGKRGQFGADPTAVALSADGRRVALLRPAEFPPLAKGAKDDPANPRKASAPADLTVWDVAGGEVVYHTEFPEPSGTTPTYLQPTFTPDNAIVAVTQHAGTKPSLRMFDLTNRREKSVIEFRESRNLAPQFSPDGQRVAFVEWKDEQPLEKPVVALYDLATGTRRTLDVRVSPGANLTWSPDGKRLLVPYSTINEREHNLYDVATGNVTASLYTGDQVGRREVPGNQVLSTGPVFSPDGRRIADVVTTRQSAVVRVWDAESGKVLLSIPLAPRSVTGFIRRDLYHLAFTPDGHKLLAVTTQALRGGAPGFNDTSSPITVTTYDATPRPVPKQP